jgi:hypothetical protein
MGNRRHHGQGLTLVGLLCCGLLGSLAASPASIAAPLTNALAFAETNLVVARRQFAAAPTNATVAWQLGRACFAWGQFLTNRAAQESTYTEGLNACRRSLAVEAKSAPAYYYLGMNLGRIADLKRNLSAFSMVKEVEKSFHRARQLDENFAHAGPDRNLGLLYHHAPGWPLSVGDQELARKHLQRAAKLAADYPENRLNLAEAALAWKDQPLFQSEWQAIEALWPQAKTNLAGLAWELDWHDWENRRAALQRKLAPK